MNVGSPADLVSALVRFCVVLRARGVPVTAGAARDALRALEVVDLGDREEVRRALRAVLASRQREIALFDEAFETFWAGARAHGVTGDASPGIEGLLGKRPSRAFEDSPQLASWTDAVAGTAEAESLPGLSDIASVKTRDFSGFAAGELEEVERLAARLARRLATRRSRRLGPPGPRGRVDLRRTLRASLTRGEPLELVRRQRKLQRTKLVVICDVSGSMDLYSRLLVRFLHALQNQLGRVETFVFSTGLARVTEELAGRSYRDALGELARVEGWSGGTRIGGSLVAFLEGWRRLLDRETVVVILSDGWDTGEPEALAEALREMRRAAGKLVWLNPLLGGHGYQPLTRGMAAALPHLDAFLPAHNLDSLRELVRHLRV